MHHRLAEIPARAMLAKASEAGEPVRRSPVLQNLLAMAAASDAFAHRELGPSRAARSIIQARAARRRFFDSELFADPAWDMLLELYALEGEGLRISVSKLSLAAGVPCTTALRWLDKLESESLLVREEDPTDGRSRLSVRPDSDQAAPATLSRSGDDDASDIPIDRFEGALQSAAISRTNGSIAGLDSESVESRARRERRLVPARDRHSGVPAGRPLTVDPVRSGTTARWPPGSRHSIT